MKDAVGRALCSSFAAFPFPSFFFAPPSLPLSNFACRLLFSSRTSFFLDFPPLRLPHPSHHTFLFSSPLVRDLSPPPPPYVTHSFRPWVFYGRTPLFFFLASFSRIFPLPLANGQVVFPFFFLPPRQLVLPFLIDSPQQNPVAVLLLPSHPLPLFARNRFKTHTPCRNIYPVAIQRCFPRPLFWSSGKYCFCLPLSRLSAVFPPVLYPVKKRGDTFFLSFIVILSPTGDGFHTSLRLLRSFPPSCVSLYNRQPQPSERKEL